MIKKKNILIIDDEVDICNYTKSILERTGKFEVTTTTDPRNGIKLVKSIKPDLIILDVNMPAMDGGDVAYNLSKDEFSRNIPILFLTGLAKKGEFIQDERLGTNYILAKPIETEELINKIELILEK